MALCPALAAPPVPVIITIDNINSIVVSTYDRTPGTVVTVSCFVPQSYSLVGESVLTCLDNGLWDHSVPQCVSNKLMAVGAVTTTVRPTSSSALNFLPYMVALPLAALICLTLAIILCCAAYHWRKRDRKMVYLEKRSHSPGTVMTSLRDYRFYDKTPRESWKSYPPNSTIASLDRVMMSRDHRMAHIPRPSWFTMLPRQEEIEPSYYRSHQSVYN